MNIAIVKYNAGNIYSRSISNYLTGEDAIEEAALIEEKLYDIENDLWDY